MNDIKTVEINKRYISYIRPEEASDICILISGEGNKEENEAYTAEIYKFLKPLVKKELIPSFSLFSVTTDAWDRDYSPWEADLGERHFEGGLDAFLNELKAVIIPELKELTGAEFIREKTYFTGYSLAGLAALYGIIKTDIFDKGACVSGSLWYEGFIDYLREHIKAFNSNNEIYISLGKKEIKSRSPLLSKNGEYCEEAVNLLGNHANRTTFVWNNGNHFYEVPQRVARAILWMLNTEVQPGF